jgi:YHS domain-containing protein
MSQVKDPVCGMMIDPEEAAGSTTFEGHEIYFCSDQCRREFEADPAHYYDRIEAAGAGLHGEERLSARLSNDRNRRSTSAPRY